MDGSIAETSLKISALMGELADISDDLDAAGYGKAAEILDEAYCLLRKARLSIRREVA